MKEKSYTLVGPDFAATMSINSFDIGIYISTLCWVVDTIMGLDYIKKMPIAVELITAEYMGPFPSIAIYYEDKSFKNMHDEIEALSEKIFHDSDFKQYFDYVANNRDRIAKAVKAYQDYPTR